MRGVVSGARRVVHVAVVALSGASFVGTALSVQAVAAPLTCEAAKTKSECSSIPGCRVYNDKDGQSYCVKDTKDYPPVKLGYPLLA